MNRIISGFSYLVALFLLTSNYQVAAQIEADNTLPVNSNAIKNGINFKINGGTVRGNNLFHSFKKFNVPTKGEAFFDNTNSIENIFTRVTGNSISNIDGIIKANGSANLFLMNPNGIIFGENASLNIGGSFIGTTADSIKFTEGEFSAINPQAPPLLTINVPMGLQMGTNPGAIQLEGEGHNLAFNEFSPIMGAGSFQTGLRVESGKTLAMVGGDILSRGGILSAPSGRIDLGSVDALETVSFDTTNTDGILGYQNVEKFRDIKLLSRTLLDASGFRGGDIRLSARNIILSNRSASITQNLGPKPSGNTNIYASESLTLTADAANLNPAIATENLTSGNGGNITIETKQMSLQNGGAIIAKNWNQGRSGSVSVDAFNVELDGVSVVDPFNFHRSSISAINYGSGNGGDVTISTKQLAVSNGGIISSSTVGSGEGGNITVNATDFVKLEGYEPQIFLISSISSSSLSAGNAGNLNINTASLIVRDGGSINAAAFASGNAGSITVNAQEFVEVSGIGQNSLDISNIVSSAVNPTPLVQKRFRLPKLTTSNAGNVIINTPTLRLTDNGAIGVRNNGTGDAGIAEINARSLLLDKGRITAATAKGEGGNISLQADTLQMRRNSNITATAMGEGSGGNININTDSLVALENSDITANAQNSFGGRITINAQGVFGIREREAITNQSDITASSQLGASFNGTVELNTPGIDPSKAVNQLPANITDPTNQIASECSAQTGNKFVITGRGGIPQNPSDRVSQNIIWSDVRNLSLYRQEPNSSNQITRISKQRRIIEATGFEVNQLGEVELVAKMAENTQKWQSMPNCRDA